MPACCRIRCFQVQPIRACRKALVDSSSIQIDSSVDLIRRNSMSLCHETYRRCASVALVLAVVLIALPALLNAQTAPTQMHRRIFPRWNGFIGYQWLNPGGNIPDQQQLRPMRFQAALDRPGLRHQSGLQLHQVSGSRRQLRWRLEPLRRCQRRHRRAEVHLARRGRELFRAHAGRI